MKVLLVHNSYQQPGGEDLVFAYERELLQRAGHQVLTYCRSNREIEESCASRRMSLLAKIVWAKDTHEEIARLLRQETAELVHVHNTFMMVSPSIYAACGEARVPVVQTLHNYRLLCPAATFYRDGKVCEECVERGLWRGVCHGCYRQSQTATAAVALMIEVHRRLGTWAQRVNGYIALTEFARQKFIAGGLPPEKIAVKPNFVHPDPGVGSGDGDYALFAGRLAEEKGAGILLEAWKRLRIRVPLNILGEGPSRSSLEAEAVRNGLCSIHFHGHLGREETWAAMKGCRFLILPSQCYENCPMTVMEAFACGTPIICSRLGALRELVADHRTGLHFAPTDAEDLADKVHWAWTHPREMSEMGKEARKEYESKYTPEKNYSLLMEIYQRALATYACSQPN